MKPVIRFRVKYLVVVVALSGFLSLIFNNDNFAFAYTLGLATSGTVNLDVSTVGNGTAVATDNLVATSTCPLGYTITIQGPSDSGLYKDGHSVNAPANNIIAASAGTPTNPAVITGANRGTWGYSLTSSTGTDAFIGLTSTPTTLITKNTASGDGVVDSDTIPVHYGVSTRFDQEPGLYTLDDGSTINYAITAPLSCTSNTVTLIVSGASGIIVDGVTYPSGVTVISLAYGTHTVSGTYLDGYEFNIWSAAGNVAITDTTAAFTTINVTGEGRLALSGKKIYMQDFTLTRCQANVGMGGNAANVGDVITVFDKRADNYFNSDEASYTVRYINGACWMTQNLRIRGNISATYSNFSTNNSFNPCTGDLDAGSSATEARCHDSGNTTNGVWYNLVAASAGTTAGSDYVSDIAEDICPAGWHLPTYDASNSAGSVNSLTTLTDVNVFSPVTGGNYNNGSLVSTNYGYWWTSSAGNGSGRNALYYTNNSLNITSGAPGVRGLYIRCVRDVDPVNLNLNLNNASGIVIDGVTYSSITTTVSLDYGTHTISGVYPDGYEFDSWAVTGNVTVVDANAASTTINVTGVGALTLNGKRKTYIQNFTAAQCNALASNANYTVYDRRDGKAYTVRYLQGACWMTQNLRITGNISATYSNFSTNSSFNPCTGDLDAGSSATEARCHDSGNTTNGVWYNLVAVSAGTEVGSGSPNDITEDICPAGWHLPIYDVANSAGSVNSLTTLIDVNVFSPVTGGNYNNGSLANTYYGYWWTSSVGINFGWSVLYYGHDSLNVSNGALRSRGFYIRCVRT